MRLLLHPHTANPAGWVLLIGEEFEQARVLVALLISLAFLALHMIFKPFKR